MKPRMVEPEWLDQLPSDDPQAIASRADLRWINRMMGHASQMARLFLTYAEPGIRSGRRLRVADLGGGDGTLLLRLAQGWSALGITADADIPDVRAAVSSETVEAFCKLGWSVRVETVDALCWAREPGGDGGCRQPSYDLVICNLFLHHFEDAGLAVLLGGIARSANLFIACEPRRSSLALWGAGALRWIRCSPVTLHDARVSVHAGFSGDELSRLWLGHAAASEWHLAEGRRCFSHYFVAKRR